MKIQQLGRSPVDRRAHNPEVAGSIPAPATNPPLSPREYEAAMCVAGGLTQHEIADAMGVAVRTANAHVENGMSKLGAINRAHYVTRLFTSGYLVRGQVGHIAYVSVAWSLALVALTFSIIVTNADMVRPNRTPLRPIVRIVKTGRNPHDGL